MNDMNKTGPESIILFYSDSRDRLSQALRDMQRIWKSSRDLGYCPTDCYEAVYFPDIELFSYGTGRVFSLNPSDTWESPRFAKIEKRREFYVFDFLLEDDESPVPLYGDTPIPLFAAIARSYPDIKMAYSRIALDDFYYYDPDDLLGVSGKLCVCERLNDSQSKFYANSNEDLEVEIQGLADFGEEIEPIDFEKSFEENLKSFCRDCLKIEHDGEPLMTGIEVYLPCEKNPYKGFKHSGNFDFKRIDKFFNFYK